MTPREAIHELKMLMNKCRGDFYNDRRTALEMAINALYEQEVDDEYDELDRTAYQGTRYKDIEKRH